jgi:hypothetical protein
MKNISVLIPTRFVWDGICLTLESMLRRTRDVKSVEIIVCDNSEAPNNRACEPPRKLAPGADDGNRREYLRDLARTGVIRLIENHDQAEKYGHGENVRVLLEHAETPYAMLFVSSAEIMRADWLDVLVGMIRDPAHDLGVARYRPAANHWDNCWITPSYRPNWMLLNVPLYRKFYPENSWDLETICLDKFSRPELFDGLPPLKHPEHTPPLVFGDTGWRLWERLAYDNPDGLRMLPLPDGYYAHYTNGYGGLDRNSHRPDHPYVVDMLAQIKTRLDLLRAEPRPR